MKVLLPSFCGKMGYKGEDKMEDIFPLTAIRQLFYPK